MKAITLWQPWATLIADGIKTLETRTWEPPADLIGQRIAIHAAKRPMTSEHLTATVVRELLQLGFGQPSDLPYGAVVCTVVIRWVFPTDGDDRDLYGDYSEGRFVWQLADLEKLDPPVPAKGHQRFWEWER